jgi:LysM repeat protein
LCRYGPEYNLEQQEKRMLNGQLQLTDMNLGASMTRLRRPLFAVGVLSLAILAGCASKGTRAPVVDMTGGQPAPTATSGSYVVKPGDTLYKIARANNVDIENIKRWNNISDPNQISVGQASAGPARNPRGHHARARRHPHCASGARGHQAGASRGRCGRHQLGLAGQRPDRAGL